MTEAKTEQGPMRKIPRATLRVWAKHYAETKQGGKCPLCGEAIELATRGNKTDWVVDHDHETGEIRGVLHRSCNGAEGKAANAMGRWGAKSMSYKDIVPFAKRLVAYWESEGAGVMYPDHKTPEERKEAQRVKRNKAETLRRAKKKLAEKQKAENG